MRATNPFSMIAPVLVVLCAATGCSLIYDPCGDLDERLCGDLGADCQTFRDNERIHRSVVPLRRRSAERSQCEMMVHDENYHSYTLPFVQNQIDSARDPGAGNRPLSTPHHVDGLVSGVGTYLYCCIPPFMIAGILVFSFLYRRRLGQRGG